MRAQRRSEPALRAVTIVRGAPWSGRPRAPSTCQTRCKCPDCTAQLAVAALPLSTRTAMASQLPGAWPVPCGLMTPLWTVMTTREIW